MSVNDATNFAHLQTLILAEFNGQGQPEIPDFDVHNVHEILARGTSEDLAELSQHCLTAIERIEAIWHEMTDDPTPEDAAFSRKSTKNAEFQEYAQLHHENLKNLAFLNGAIKGYQATHV